MFIYGYPREQIIMSRPPPLRGILGLTNAHTKQESPQDHKQYNRSCTRRCPGGGTGHATHTQDTHRRGSACCPDHRSVVCVRGTCALGQMAVSAMAAALQTVCSTGGDGGG